MAHNGTKNTSSRPGPFRSAADLAFAAHRCMAGGILGVGRIGGWSLALSGLLVASFTQNALAGPEGAQVVRGDVSITRNGAETLIRAGRNSIINYRNFDIGANETVRFQQPDAASRVLNRVYSAQPTRIDGSLIANGRVYIVNPAGVLFSASARVDTNGLYAAAGKLSDSDFLKGINRFTDMSGRVVNEGVITSDFVGLLGKSVGNSGQIIAPGGTIVMAAGESVMVGERKGNVFVKVSGNADDVAKAAVDNTGTIDARRGSVTMAAGDVYSMAMRVGGSIKAKNVRAQAKTGEVRVTGTIDASAGQGGGAGEQGKGGRVEVLGEKVGLFDASIDASGTRGGGDVRIGGDVMGKGDLQKAQYAYMSKDSTINVDATGNGDGGTAVIWSDEISRVYGDITARGGAQGGDGGFIETSAKGYVDIASELITAGAARGKAGNWLIDPRTVNITAGGVDEGVIVGDVFSPNADNANLRRATIQTALNSDTSITVTTADALGAQAGDINVNATITKSAGAGSATLTLRAANDINVSQAITASSGTLNLVLQANNDPGDLNVNAGNVNITANIDTNGGTFSSSGVNFANSGSGTITANGATINHTGTIAFGAATSAGAGTMALTGTTISQTAAITAGTLTLSGTGTTTLGSANSISAISGSRTGAITVNTSTALAVGASGLSSGGNDISLTSGNLSVGGAVNAGAGDVTLSTGSITQTAAINGDDLSITATGAVTLNGANSVTTVSGSTTTGAFAFTNSGLLTVGASGITGSGSNVSLTSTSGGVALNGDVSDTGTVALSGSTLSQTGGNTISAGTLTLSGTGTATLTEANAVTNISGSRTGAISFTNNGDLTVAAAGLSSGGSNITLTSDALSVNGALNAGAGAITFTSAGAITQTAAITAASLSITNNNTVTLNSSNQVGTLSVVLSASNNVAFTNGIAMAIGASGIDSQGGNITLNTGALTIGGAINAGAGDLDITAAGATQTAALIGNDLILGGTGTFVLTNTSNAFDTVTGALTGAVSLFDSSALTVGGLGLSTSDAGALSIESSSLTLNANASAGATNDVTLTTDALVFGGSGAVTGLNITVRNQSAGTAIGVGDGAAGAFAVPTATLTTNFNSTGVVTFGRSDASVSGAIDVAAGLDLSGETFGLGLAGGNASGISLHGLTLASNKNLTINSVGTVTNDTGLVSLSGTGILSITSTGAVTQSAGFITPALVLNGAGPFTLDSSANQVGALSGSPTGGVELLTAGNLSIGTLSMGSNTLNLDVDSGTVTQTGAITAGGVRLAGDGTYVLTNPANDIDTLATSASGNISLTEVDGFTVGTVVDTGITSNGADVTLNSTGGITISQAVALSGGDLSLTSGGATTQSASITADALTLGGAGSFNLNNSGNDVASVGGTVTGNITLRDSSGLVIAGLTSSSGNIDLQVDAGSVTQTGSLTASGLALRGAGAYVLTTGTNDVDTFASSATGDVQFTDTDGLTVGTVGIAGITSSGADVRLSASGPIAISSAINLGAGNLGLSTSGAVSQTAAITAAGLRLTGSGTFTLTSSSNTLGTLAAGTTGAIEVTNSQTLDVGTVLGSTGISSGGQNVTLTTTAGSITLGQNVNVGAGTLALNGAAGGSQTGSITAGTLTLAGGGYTLLNSSNAVGTLSGTFNGALQYRDTDGLTVGTLDSTSNAITINLPAGAMSITGAVSGSTVSLTAQGISESGSGTITATSLTLAGTGTFNLSGDNAVDALQGTVTGPITFVNTSALNINGTLSSGGSNIAITAPDLTVSNAINAGAGSVSIITNTAAINAGVTGSAISIANQTAGVTIGLNSGATLSLSLAELANLNTTGTVTIGSATAGAITTGLVDLPSNGNSFALSLQGDSIDIGSIVMDAGDQLTLNAVNNGISQTGGIFTDALLLGGVGFMNLTSSSNQIRRVAGSATGNVRITNDATTVMVVDTVGASSSLAVTSGLTALIAPAGITINIPITSPGGGAQFTTDSIAINAAVSAPGITIDNSTSALSVGVGSGAGTLSVSDAELALLDTTGSVVIGSSTAGVVTTSAIDLPTLGRSFALTLTGDSISTGGIIMDTGDELTLSAASGGASQSGPISASNLTLTGGGTFLLNDSTNTIDSVRGSVTGAITIVNSDALTIGGALASNGFNIGLDAPSLNILNTVTAGAGDVSLTTNDITINAAVSGTNILVANRSAATTIGLGGAAGSLNISDAEFSNLAPSASGTVTIGSSTAGAMEVQSLVSSTGADLNLIAASINTIGGLNVGSGSNLRLEGVSGGVSQDEGGAGLIADTVTLAGAGSFSLDNTTNDIATLDGSVNGSILYIDFNALTIGASGLASNGNDITVIGPTSLTVNGAVDAGAGELTLLANSIDIAADVTGQAGISLAPISDGISIGLAGASGTFNLTTTELGHLVSSGLVSIGRGGVDAGALDAGDIDATITGFNRDYSLSLLGTSIGLGNVAVKTGKSVTLTAAAGNIQANQIDAPAGFTATATDGAGRGIFTVNSGVTTSNAAIAIDGDLNVGGSNVTLTSGGGDINVTGFIVTGADNTNQLSLLASGGDLVVGGTIGSGTLLGAIGSESNQLLGLIATGDAISLPSVFAGTQNILIVASGSFTSLATVNTTVNGSPATPTSLRTRSGGSISVTGAGTASVPGAVDSDGFVLFSNGGTTTLGNQIITTNDLITFTGNVIATTNLTMNAGTAGIGFAPTSTVSLGAGNSVLTADEINLPTGADAVSGNGTSTTLLLQSATAGQNVTLGNAASDADATLELSDSELSSLASSITSLTIGRSDGSGTVLINSAAFRSTVTIQAPTGAGVIVANGITQETLGADVTLNGSTAAQIGAEIVTRGGDITIQDNVVLTGDVTLDTTAAGTVTGADNTGNVTVAGTIEGTTDGNEGITIAAGTSGTAGVDGVISLGGAVGATNSVANFTISSADSATLPSIRSADFVDITGRTFTFSSGVTTLNGGQFRINNSGLVTIDTAAFNVEGGFVQNAAATGDISLGADILTQGGQVIFTNDLALTSNVTIDSGSGNTITFGGLVDGAQSLSISAGNVGAVSFDDAVGSVTPLTSLSVTNSGSITLASVSGGPTVRAGQVSLSSSGLVTINGTGTDGGIDSDATVAITGGSITQNGLIIARDSGADITLNADGAITIANDLTVGSASGQIEINSGNTGVGDLTFVGTPTLTADTILLTAGDGVGGAGATAIVQAQNGSGGPIFAGITSGSPRSRSLTITQDGNITDSTLPVGAQFTDGRSALLYSLTSEEGTVTIANPATIADTRLTLTSTASTTPNIFITGPISVVSLTTNGNASITGNITATGVTLFDSTVVPGNVTFNGPVTLDGNINTSGDICIQSALTLLADTTFETSGSGIIQIKAAVDAGSNDLTLTAADVDFSNTGSLTGTGDLVFQTNAAGDNIVLGNALDSDAGFDLTSDGLSSSRLVPGFASITFGRADGTGVLSLASAVTLDDPATFRMGGIGGSITIGNALTGTGNAGFTFDAPTTAINAAVTLAGGDVRILDDATLGTATIATGGGLVDISGDVTLTGDSTINTSGGNVRLGSTVNADATANSRVFTINAGAGTVTFLGDIGTDNGTLLSSLSSTASRTTIGSAHTAAGQTYTGDWTVGGTVLADSGTIEATGNTTLSANTTLTATGGDVTLGGTLDSATAGSERTLVISAPTGAISITGDAGSTVRLQSFSATANTIQTASVKTIAAIDFTGDTTLNGGVNPVVIDGTDITFNSPVVLDSNTTVNATGAATFDSTIRSATSIRSTLAVNSPVAVFGGNIGGASGDSAELGSLTTNDGGSLSIAASSILVFGDITFGDAITLTNDLTVDSGGSISFRSTIDSDSVSARALTVNSGGSTANTVFLGNVGSANALASLTTNAAGTTFLPATIRTTGAQVYLDNIRLANNDTVLTAGSFNFDQRINSDTSVRSLTLNASGQTRLGGEVGGVISGSPEALALATLTTDAAGTLLIGGNVTTSSSQSYGEDTQLIGDVVLSGNGITFANAIRSQDGGPTRALTMAGGAAGVTVSGSIGVGSNLTSLTASGSTISVRAVQTTGSQSYTGTTTIVGDAAALNGDFDVFGTATVTGDIQGNNVRFRRQDSLTAAPTSLTGNITSTLSGATISFQDDLSIGANTAVSGSNATVTFGGRVNTLGSNARSLTVNTSGVTTFTGAVGDTNRLSSVATDAAGTTLILGGLVSSTGAVTILDPAVLGANTSIAGTDVTFGSTVDGDAAGRNLTITGTGTTTFGGALGATQSLGRLLVNDQNNNRVTVVGGNITTSNGMVFGGPVRLTQNSIMNGGSGTLFFRGTIDTDTSASATRSLTLLSDAVVKLATNGDATDIASGGSTAGDVTVIPFRFAGSIGAIRPLNSLTLGAARSSSPQSASAVFAAPLNGIGGFDASGRIVTHTGMFDTVTRGDGKRAATSSFVITVDGNGFAMGAGQKLTAFGNIAVNATGRPVTLSDMSATGRIDVTAGSIGLTSFSKTAAFTNVLVAGTYTTRPEFLVDFVAKHGIDFNLPGNAPLTGSIGLFATDSGVPGNGLDGQIFGRFESATGTAAVISQALFNAPGSTSRLLPIDLVASQSPTNAASALAGAIPRDNREREVTQAVILSAAFGKTLENIQLFTKALDAQTLAEFLVGRALYQDVPATLNPVNSDRKVSLNRLSNQPVLATIEAYCDLAYEDGAAAFDNIVQGKPVAEPRLGQLKDAVSAAWEEYVNVVGEAGASGRGFRQHLEEIGASGNENEKLAILALDKARALLERVDDIGLSPRERLQVREAIINSIGGGQIKDLESAIIGRAVAMVTQ